MQSDAERWNQRYEGRFGSWPRPPEGLADVDVASVGRCLDIACGLGEQSVWAARRGLDVIALDVSEVAVAATVELARTYAVDEHVDARVRDLDEGLSDVSSGGDFDVVICQRFRAPQLYSQIARAVAPGGWLSITVLSEVGGGPGPFRASATELLWAFEHCGLQIVSHVEAEGEATLTARRLGDVAV